jgi:hypothetical protein
MRFSPANALADAAVLDSLDTYLTVDPEGRLSQRDFHVYLGIPTPARATTSTTEGGPGTESISKECVEDILEPSELVPTTRISARASTSRHLMSVGVVGPPGLWIGEDFVSLCKLLEAFLGLRVARVRIWVVGAG